jgi:hypothetical protein
VPLVIQPPQVKPTTMVSTETATHDQNRVALDAWYSSHRWLSDFFSAIVPSFQD